MPGNTSGEGGAALAGFNLASSSGAAGSPSAGLQGDATLGWAESLLERIGAAAPGARQQVHGHAQGPDDFDTQLGQTQDSGLSSSYSPLPAPVPLHLPVSSSGDAGRAGSRIDQAGGESAAAVGANPRPTRNVRTAAESNSIFEIKDSEGPGSHLWELQREAEGSRHETESPSQDVLPEHLPSERLGALTSCLLPGLENAIVGSDAADCMHGSRRKRRIGIEIP